MARTKVTVRRLPIAVPISQGHIGNKNILNRQLRSAPFKSKQIIPEMKRVAVKKNEQVIREMNVRRKSIYFSGKRSLNY